MSEQLSNHETERVGSPYIEVEPFDVSIAQDIAEYYKDVTARHNHWVQSSAPYRHPELGPGQTELEIILLKQIFANGKVNLWDFYDSFEGSTVLDDEYHLACQTLIDALKLEVKIV